MLLGASWGHDSRCNPSNGTAGAMGWAPVESGFRPSTWPHFSTTMELGRAPFPEALANRGRSISIWSSNMENWQINANHPNERWCSYRTIGTLIFHLHYHAVQMVADWSSLWLAKCTVQNIFQTVQEFVFSPLAWKHHNSPVLPVFRDYLAAFLCIAGEALPLRQPKGGVVRRVASRKCRRCRTVCALECCMMCTCSIKIA